MNIDSPIACDHTGRTLLMAALEAERFMIVKLLLRRGADVEARNLLGQTCLWDAVRANGNAMFELLLQ